MIESYVDIHQKLSRIKLLNIILLILPGIINN